MKKFLLISILFLIVIAAVIDIGILKKDTYFGSINNIVLDTSKYTSVTGTVKTISVTAASHGSFRVVADTTVLDGQRFSGNYFIAQGEMPLGEWKIVDGDSITVDILSSSPVVITQRSTAGHVFGTIFLSFLLLILAELLLVMVFFMLRD